MSDGESRLPTSEEVRRWTASERAEVARMLDRLVARPVPGEISHRRRLLVLLVTIGGAVALLPWISYLSVVLPARASGGAWRTAWVGFDVILASAFGCAGWLAWHRRQLATIALPVAATLVLMDAWFDVSLSWGTADQWGAVATAVLGEIPVAVVLVAGSRTLLGRSMSVVQELRGLRGSQVSLWRLSLVMVPPTDPTD